MGKVSVVQLAQKATESLDDLVAERNRLQDLLVSLPRKLQEIQRRINRIALPNNALNLTHRQQQVLLLVRDNKSNKEIGNALNITGRTAKQHVSMLLQKFNVRDRGELIRCADL